MESVISVFINPGATAFNGNIVFSYFPASKEWVKPHYAALLALLIWFCPKAALWKAFMEDCRKIDPPIIGLLHMQVLYA